MVLGTSGPSRPLRHLGRKTSTSAEACSFPEERTNSNLSINTDLEGDASGRAFSVVAGQGAGAHSRFFWLQGNRAQSKQALLRLSAQLKVAQDGPQFHAMIDRVAPVLSVMADVLTHGPPGQQPSYLEQIPVQAVTKLMQVRQNATVAQRWLLSEGSHATPTAKSRKIPITKAPQMAPQTVKPAVTRTEPQEPSFDGYSKPVKLCSRRASRSEPVAAQPTPPAALDVSQLVKRPQQRSGGTDTSSAAASITVKTAASAEPKPRQGVETRSRVKAGTLEAQEASSTTDGTGAERKSAPASSRKQTRAASGARPKAKINVNNLNQYFCPEPWK
eukprot:scaffold351770_cov40-Prasinocladus_malaysianus.AAC.2